MSNSEYLYAYLGVLTGLSITQLVKSFNLLVKYSVSGIDRWSWRWAWLIHMSFLLFQFMWGLKGKIGDIDNLLFFFFFLVISGLMYSLIVYVFPDSTEDIYKNEINQNNLKGLTSNEKEEKDKYNAELFTTRLINLYYIYIAWIASTLISNFCVFKDKLTLIVIFGISLKIICIILVVLSLRSKIILKNRKIKNIDYAFIIISTFMLFVYTILRDNKVDDFRIKIYGDVSTESERDIEGATIEIKTTDSVYTVKTDTLGNYRQFITINPGSDNIIAIECRKDSLQSKDTLIIFNDKKINKNIILK